MDEPSFKAFAGVAKNHTQQTVIHLSIKQPSALNFTHFYSLRFLMVLFY